MSRILILAFRLLLKGWLLLGFMLGGNGLAEPAVTRGPYLQSASARSMVIRWRTDEPTFSRVTFGFHPDALTRQAKANGNLTEHVVLLKDLVPGTRYYYSIGAPTNQVFASGLDYYFITPPEKGKAKPVRFWALGDAGTQTTRQTSVRDAYLRVTGERHTDLVLLLGDNAYPAGTDKEYQGAVFNMYRNTLRSSPLFPTIGNHDARSANSATQSGVYFDIFTLPAEGQCGGVASATEAFYSFDYANIHFICLDSEDSDRAKSGRMIRWLKEDLAVNQLLWTVAYFHHPPYSKGKHDADNPSDSGGRMKDMRENFLPVLEAGGVDLLLSGHSHSYERTYMLGSYYTTSTNFASGFQISPQSGLKADGMTYRKEPGQKGTVYVVAGSAGEVSGGKLNHPAMFTSMNELGSLAVDVDGPELTASFIDSLGQTRDSFTISKKVISAGP